MIAQHYRWYFVIWGLCESRCCAESTLFKRRARRIFAVCEGAFIILMMQATPSNDASLEEQMMQAAPSNDASSEDQMMQATKRKLSAQETERLVCCFCTEWRTAQEIADYLHRTKDLVRNVIRPRLLKQGVLEQRFSVKRHPNQQYRAGREE